MTLKKVLIIGPQFYGYNQSINQAFKKLGWDTHTIEHYPTCPPGFVNKLLCLGMIKIGVYYFVRKYDEKVNKIVLDSYSEFEPVLVLVVRGHKLFTETIEKMNTAITVLWMLDSIFTDELGFKTLINIKLFKYRFMFEKTDVDRLKQLGISSWFLPVGYDENIYFPINNQEKNIDILMAGIIYPKREKILNHILKEFGNYRVEIHGDYLRWSYPYRFFKFYFLGYNRYYSNRAITPTELNKLYSSSKISINIHNDQSVYACNPRFFEAIGAGSFHISDEKLFIKDQFGESVVTYNSIQELIEKIKFYLDNAELRSRYAIEGHLKAISQHTFYSRIAEMLLIIEHEVGK